VVGQYLARRLVLMVVTLLGVTFLVFLILRLIPGGVETAILGEQATPEQFEALRKSLGLDKPIMQQYVSWLSEIVRGDLGESVVSKRPIGADIRARMPVTFQLGLMAMGFSILIAVPVGILAAVRQDTLGDYAARSFAIALLSIPGFWLGTLVITFGARLFGYAPPLTYVKLFANPAQNMQIMVPPAIILGAALSGTVMRLTRAQMLEVLRQDYIRTAWSKGLREGTVVWRHALRNAAIPVVTLIGLQVPVLFGGTVVLEQIFSIPGTGRYLITAVNGRDFPVIQAVVLLIATVVVVSNLVVDVAYSVLDPRVKYG
jgi:peptide/nickel transport system permease protein